MNQGIKNKQKKHIEEETTDMLQLNEEPSEPQQHLKMPRKCSDPGKNSILSIQIEVGNIKNFVEGPPGKRVSTFTETNQVIKIETDQGIN